MKQNNELNGDLKPEHKETRESQRGPRTGRHITKACLFKYIENFTTTNWKFQIKNSGMFKFLLKKGKQKVQGVPQSQTAALPRNQEEEESNCGHGTKAVIQTLKSINEWRIRMFRPTNLNKHKSNKRTKSTKISSLFSKWGNRNAKRTEKHKKKKWHKVRNKTNRLVEQTTKQQRVRLSPGPPP